MKIGEIFEGLKIGDVVKTPHGSGTIRSLGTVITVELEDGAKQKFKLSDLSTGVAIDIKKRDPNWSTLEAKRRSSAAGAHKNKKREIALGKTKHKGTDIS
jgi:hypothetical protein